MGERKYDLTIYGATGFTGSFVFQNTILWQDIENRKRKVAIAGRNKEKLVQVIKDAEAQLDRSLGDVGIIIADSSDKASLITMCQQSKVILNAVGPYTLYGEPVVEACLQAGTHMVDISGEFNFIDSNQVKYHEQAKEAGVYIISACGWDSIPAEIGLNFLREQFKDGELETAEGFNAMDTSKPVSINHGTLDSIAEMVPRTCEIMKIRKELYAKHFKKEYPPAKRNLKKKFYPNYRENIGWCVPFISENIGLANISAAWFWETKGERPVQFFEYTVLPNVWVACFMLVAMSYMFFMSYFCCTRKLLLRFPEIFTFGVFSKKGPTRKQLKELQFTLDLVGVGTGSNSQSKTVKVRVAGPDPGYETTSRCLIQAGLSILDESDKMPFTGGVIPPGFAFRNTSIIDRLNRHGVTFKVISQ